MIQTNLETIYDYLSGERALDSIRKITTFHRIQASPGYRGAASWCAGHLRAQGLRASVRSYPARDDVKFLEHRMFQEWSCDDAWLELSYPRQKRLADFRSNSLSVIQRSIPVDFRDRDIDVVMLKKGARAEDYADVDLKGKIIFIHDSYGSYMQWAVEEKGAVGIISDYMAEFKPVRYREDLYDELLYTSFWWQGSGTKAFGFVLSPRAGDELREICENLASDNLRDPDIHPYPQVRGWVDSKLYDGYTENVEALIEGETEEEILAVAHLCHPRPSANDNASGAAAAMEAVKTIKDLIDFGRLQRPKRSIRLILVPEFTGSYAFLTEHEDTSHIKAGINLDMVGGSQSKVLGPLLVCGLPDAGASFVTDLADMLMEGLRRDVKIFFTVDTYVSCVNTGRMKFMSGSDNYIFSDPDIGIPMVALSQLPDKTYHTSGDTVDKIDPAVLKKSSAVCAAYLYTLATLSVDDALQIMNKTRSSVSKLMANLSEEYGGSELRQRAEYCKEVNDRAADDYLRFFDGEDAVRMKEAVEKEKAYLRRLTDSLCQLSDDMKGQAPETGKICGYEPTGKVPVRQFRGPVAYTEYEKFLRSDLRQRLEELKEKYKSVQNMGGADVYSMLWCDGRRDLSEIACKAELESGLSCQEYIYEYFDILAEAGLIRYKEEAI